MEYFISGKHTPKFQINSSNVDNAKAFQAYNTKVPFLYYMLETDQVR